MHLAPLPGILLSVFLEDWPAYYKPDNNEHAAVSRQSGITTHSALWIQRGELVHNSKTLQQGSGIYLGEKDSIINDTNQSVTLLRFVICEASSDESNHDKQTPAQLATEQTSGFHKTCVQQEVLNNVPYGAIMRLDEVYFPPGAIAYRHTHPGPGIRYLVYGGLTLDSDHTSQFITPGEAWFEEANSPVIASATSTEPSLFVRLMLLPKEFTGQGTLTLLDEEDKKKPRLQTNTRHFDLPFEVTAPGFV